MSSLSVAAYLNWNYLYPQYIYPWNNFFRRIQNTPFYVQNDINIITTREVQSPLVFHVRPTLIGDDITDTYNNFISVLFPLNKAKTLLSTGVKQFIGRYIDAKNLSGLEYQYTYNVTLIPTFEYNSSSTVLVFGLNLAATPNSPVDNKIVFTFTKSESSILEPAISGSLLYNDVQILLENFKALPPVFAGWSDLNPDQQYFLILGNRIYIIVILNNDVIPLTTNINLSLNVRIVEALRTSVTAPSLLLS
jgi:hypothetical protein